VKRWHSILEGENMQVQVISSKAVPSFESIGIAHATKLGEWIFLSGQIPLDENGEIVGKGDVFLQTTRVYEILSQMLQEVGGTLDNIVKLTTFYTEPQDFSKIAEVRKQFFNRGYVAASSSFCVRSLPNPDALVEIEAIAVVPEVS